MKRIALALGLLMAVFGFMVGGVVHAQSAVELSAQVDVLGWPYVISVSDEMVDTRAYKKEGPYRIGFVTIFQANTWAVQFTQELFEEAARHGELIQEVVHLDAQGEIPRQIGAVEDLIARGIDALVIESDLAPGVGGCAETREKPGHPRHRGQQSDPPRSGDRLGGSG